MGMESKIQPAFDISAVHVSRSFLTLPDTNDYEVHSVYSSGFNLRAGRYLCFVGNKNNEQLPFGVILPLYDYQALLASGLERGNAMAWDKSSRCLISSNGLIRLGQGIVYDSRVVSCNLSHSGIRTAVSILEPYGICSDNARTDFTLPLFRAIRDRNRNRIREGVRYYLGRGRGLTPSGDDMLLGMLFINMACGKGECVLQEEVAAQLREGITTDISLSNLHAALEGLYCGSLLRFLDAVRCNHREDMHRAALAIHQFGHSSGDDMLFGILFQLKQMDLSV
ncbi:DUF2877 domain-containing protein [Enterocloster citroniae]|uniref:DUF2877 domain-containing protein n=2 Tax=Enterocloster citroniae TaxID=358743 RepID=UPI0009F4AE41|nr:DUF2877 domain-containing protein [Enterocloster citroniae]